MPDIRGNLWKYFVYSFSQRRNFIPLLSIFFLTLPGATAKQIGLYTGFGYLVALPLEIPSSYLADRIGHKKMLFIAKACMFLSSLCFVLAQGFWFVAIGSALLSIAVAFSGGVGSAFVHDTMRALRREKEYARVLAKISAYVSLLSVFFILGLPFLTPISIRLPFIVALAIDAIGLLVVFLMVSPPREYDTAPRSFKAVLRIIKQAARPGFYPFAIFTGALGGFLIADGAYRYVYLQSLGYPIIFLGAVMALSRLVWFIVGHQLKYVERIGVVRLMRIELFVYPLAYIAIAIFSNPYVDGVLFSVLVGYHWARDSLYTSHLVRRYIKNPKYKATMLSVANQIDDLFQLFVSASIGFVMAISYKLGFLVLGLLLFIVLFIAYSYSHERYGNALRLSRAA